jgi:hypothetical protein
MTKAVDEKIMEYACWRTLRGVSQEALFCLRRGGDSEGLWGDGGEYDEFISLIKGKEMEGGDEGGIELEVFFAEEDKSFGEKGSQWFDELWKGEAGGWIRHSSRMVPGTTHETIMRVESGTLESVFAKVSKC